VGEMDIKEAIVSLLENTEVGKKATVNFRGLAVPIEIAMTFSGGWKVMYTLVPGMSFEFIKGEGDHLREISITFLPHDGLQ